MLDNNKIMVSDDLCITWGSRADHMIPILCSFDIEEFASFWTSFQHRSL